MSGEYAEVGKEIREKKELSKDTDAKFKEATKRFVKNFTETKKA